MEGSAIVPEAFSMANIPVSIEIAGQEIRFDLDEKGQAIRGSNSFQVRNAGRFGLVHGGFMQFEAAISSKAVSETAGGMAITNARSSSLSIPLVMHLDSVKCSGSLPLSELRNREKP
jgi:hypothetical protein